MRLFLVLFLLFSNAAQAWGWRPWRHGNYNRLRSSGSAPLGYQMQEIDKNINKRNFREASNDCRNIGGYLKKGMFSYKEAKQYTLHGYPPPSMKCTFRGRQGEEYTYISWSHAQSMKEDVWRYSGARYMKHARGHYNRVLIFTSGYNKMAIHSDGTMQDLSKLYNSRWQRYRHLNNPFTRMRGRFNQ